MERQPELYASIRLPVPGGRRQGAPAHRAPHPGGGARGARRAWVPLRLADVSQLRRGSIHRVCSTGERRPVYQGRRE